MLLRDKLSNIFPFQAHEINSSGLLRTASNPYPDTNSNNSLLRAHRQLIRLRMMDTILQNAQRQGRISFYMTCTGEEAIHIGAASALNNQDPIFAQYREQGLLMWRGFTLEQFTNQCFSNDRDLGKGRQMPIHYGSRALNYHTVSSPLGTQLPQAVGAAYRLKLMKKSNVAICFFGDGCASTTDFHAALNFAATLSSPVIFFCRNNGYAISTPVTDQYAGDGIVSRATGYGMAAIRVDGNDLFAVHAAVREAKKYALKHNAPVLIEGMTYRFGHHSTSDDSTRYRSLDEVEEFADTMDPLGRFTLFLQRHELITEDEISNIEKEERLAILAAIKLAETRSKPNIDSMFTDVYKEMPLHLKKQLEELKQHVTKHPDKY
jgi:2-oxoisovalerate dehydrogenase E1 component alpha subunit